MTFELIANPAFDGQEPRPLAVACHDGTPFLTVRCECGFDMHMHESRAVGLEDVTAGFLCHGCGALMVFRPGFFAEGFAQMRAEGWVE